MTSQDVPMAIPAGCGALWHAEVATVDTADMIRRAADAARRTHTDQAVLLPDGTVKVYSAGVADGTTNG